VIGPAIKKQAAADDEIAAAVASMTTFNDGALAIGRRFGVTACTDVTGFGLLGHLRNLLLGSSLTATVELAALPLLPGARRHLDAGLVPGGSRANREFVTPLLRHGALDADAEARLALACDAQTSGGLLLCLPADAAADAVAALREHGLPAARVATLAAPGADQPAGTINLDG
jgi:selenide,water dikinase